MCRTITTVFGRVTRTVLGVIFTHAVAACCVPSAGVPVAPRARGHAVEPYLGVGPAEDGSSTVLCADGTSTHGVCPAEDGSSTVLCADGTSTHDVFVLFDREPTEEVAYACLDRQFRTLRTIERGDEDEHCPRFDVYARRQGRIVWCSTEPCEVGETFEFWVVQSFPEGEGKFATTVPAAPLSERLYELFGPRFYVRFSSASWEGRPALVSQRAWLRDEDFDEVEPCVMPEVPQP